MTIAYPLDERYVTLVDVQDLPLVLRYPWRVIKGASGNHYVYAKSAGRGLYLHRLIANTPRGFETDHRNGLSLDNRRSNLRIATMSQNSANTGKPRRADGKQHTSRFKGVSWSAERGKWRALITVNGQRRNLGRYTTEEEAAAVYDRAAFQAWGEFAFLNFPREGTA